MSYSVKTLGDLATLPHDQVIDVRSPAEYQTDHLPGAINLPALSNEERARVGTIYVQDDPFRARKIGAALVARNMAHHLETTLADRPGGWRPLVYCWRGGQRSGSVVSILSQIGWRADKLEHGYQAYRRLVKTALYDAPLPHRLILIDGGTGTGKTQLLAALAAEGAQVLDLEALGQHRGSLFGLVGKAQPAQKMFESRIAGALLNFDPARPVFVEAESNKLGRLILPPSLWQAMIRAPRWQIDAPLKARAQHLLTSYPDLIADTARLDDTLAQLVQYHGHDKVNMWRELARSGRFADLAEALIAQHYDPRYRRASHSMAPNAQHISLDRLDASALKDAARRLMEGETL